MKKVLGILLAVAFSFVYVCETQAQVLSPDRVDHDFGKLTAKDKPVSTVFEFTNTGTNPLIVAQVLNSCDCTKVKFTKEPIPAQGKGKIEVTFDPKNQKGIFNKILMVYSNDAAKRTIFCIKGEVEAEKK